MDEQKQEKIWVDADACPVVIKDMLFRAAVRTHTPVTLVSNQYISTPASPYVQMLQVMPGFDVADNEIVKRMSAGDLVITSDIPLAAEVIDKQGMALSPRGELYSKNNIRGRLNMRDFMDTMRASGIHTGGPPPLSQRDRQAFANHLDKILNKFGKQRVNHISE
ncbi:MAG: YaiI/YqxD family protein [Gammaproteobacteria bacterium]|nr:YaiI/YqxD family protein [Gammaproteobacteria bacterium]